ncbi:MAG TPA: ABC transporter substrate-binding protein [Paraburkholderia sp.]|nr:ABC transporter substrate-binding protein [Paraburkholderia sp.]
MPIDQILPHKTIDVHVSPRHGKKLSADTVLRVGVHPNNLHLQLAALAWNRSEDRPDIEFVNYAEGRDTGQLIAERVIDVGGTGSTPPLIAQSLGTPLVYVAASAPRKTNGAILALADGPKDIHALAGKRVALLDGSFHTHFLAAALDRAGHALEEVTRVELSPAESLGALERREVDAWIAMEPLLSDALANKPVRALEWIGDFVANRSVFWAHQSAAIEHAPALNALFDSLVRLGKDVTRDPAPFATLLADAGIGNVSEQAWLTALRQRDWSLHTVDETILGEQQAEADLLFRCGVLTRAVDVREGNRLVPIAPFLSLSNNSISDFK